MSNQNHQDQEKAEQSRTRAASALSASEYVTLRRPRPGSIVIIAPPGTRQLSVSTEEFLKIVLHVGAGE